MQTVKLIYVTEFPSLFKFTILYFNFTGINILIHFLLGFIEELLCDVSCLRQCLIGLYKSNKEIYSVNRNGIKIEINIPVIKLILV